MGGSINEGRKEWVKEGRNGLLNLCPKRWIKGSTNGGMNEGRNGWRKEGMDQLMDRWTIELMSN
jgi:hypothetical protein